MKQGSCTKEKKKKKNTNMRMWRSSDSDLKRGGPENRLPSQGSEEKNKVRDKERWMWGTSEKRTLMGTYGARSWSEQGNP